jgi:D-3-phosphoglycerate dehydrogenase
MNLKEFAKKIGVSPSTVSRALNNYPDISSKTKQTINNLAKKYNYLANAAASTIGSIKIKSNQRILIADKISEEALKIFKKNKIAIDQKYNLDEDQLAKIINNYDGIIVRSSTKVTKKIITSSRKLKIIARAGVGVDNVNVKSATAKGVVVMNSPQSTSRTTAEHTISLLFSLARKIPFAHLSLMSKNWNKNQFKGLEIKNKIIGVIGCGNIGSNVVMIAKALGLNVLVYDPFLSSDKIEDIEAEKVSLDELLKISDFVSLHLPLMESTKNIIDTKKLKIMKKSSYIINTARGGLINEKDLFRALVDKSIAGAALDVFENEPLKDSPFFELDNIILTPHLGASTREAQDNAAIQIAEQMSAFFNNGSIINSINMTSVSGQEKKSLEPYLDLCNKLGSFAGQLTETAVKAITIELEGTAAMLNKDLLTRSLVNNFLGSFIDNINSINAIDVAKDRNIRVSTLINNETSEYNSLIRLMITTERRTRSLAGSIFGGKSRIVEIKGINIDAELGNFNIYITNEDKVGVISEITNILTDNNINIATFNLGRVTKDGDAVSLIQTDQLCNENVIEKLRRIKNVNQVKSIVF